jgi:hypothetical protein
MDRCGVLKKQHQDQRNQEAANQQGRSSDESAHDRKRNAHDKDQAARVPEGEVRIFMSQYNAVLRKSLLSYANKYKGVPVFSRVLP